MSPARALELAGDWPLYADLELAELSQFEPEGGGDRLPDQWQINLRCRVCDQSCGLLARAVVIGDAGEGRETVYQTTIAELLSGVLRHKVMAHGQALNVAAAVVTPQEVVSDG